MTNIIDANATIRAIQAINKHINGLVNLAASKMLKEEFDKVCNFIDTLQDEIKMLQGKVHETEQQPLRGVSSGTIVADFNLLNATDKSVAFNWITQNYRPIPPQAPGYPGLPNPPVRIEPPSFTCSDLDNHATYVRDFGIAIGNVDLQQAGNYIRDWTAEQRRRNTLGAYYRSYHAKDDLRGPSVNVVALHDVPTHEKTKTDIATIGDVHSLVQAMIDDRVSNAIDAYTNNLIRSVKSDLHKAIDKLSR